MRMLTLSALVTRSAARRTGVATALLAVLAASACSAGGGGGQPEDAPKHSARATPSRSPEAHGAPVHLSLLQADDSEYGVGMPIIAFFNRKITDPSEFTHAVTVTVDGKPAGGAWYFENTGRDGQALEAHYRPEKYWPAHAKIEAKFPVKGLSAGKGLVYDDSLTLAIGTGTANVSSVDCTAERMTVVSDGRKVRTMPTSCGAAKTPTHTGTKVLMQKGEADPKTGKMRPDGAVRMVSDRSAAEPYDEVVPWSVRVTNSGEYVHAAAWNGGNIGHRSTSNGCTNLNVGDAKWFYGFSSIGDVVTYTRTGGSAMPTWDGYGDWNVPWSTWQDGGVVPTDK
ncbi:MAG: L,D-transpeptidase [Actinocatenispora sp.]